MKKPKPPKTFEEVQEYIREKKLNVNPQIFWDYFTVGEWYDKEGKPVLNWKQKLITWHGRDKRTIAEYKSKKMNDRERASFRRRERDEQEDWLRGKSTAALLDLKNDKRALVAHWLIDEILNKRGYQLSQRKLNL